VDTYPLLSTSDTSQGALHTQLENPLSTPAVAAAAVLPAVILRLLRLALPMMLQSLALMLLTFISTTFVGHLNDPLALSAVVLSSSLYNVSGEGWVCCPRSTEQP
jgi:hypothetical protein